MPFSAIDMTHGLTGVMGSSGIAATQATQTVPGTDGSEFAAALTGAVDNLQSLSNVSKELSIKAATGDLADVHSATIASTQAQVTLELVAAIRNKGVDAFTEIMRMQA